MNDAPTTTLQWLTLAIAAVAAVAAVIAAGLNGVLASRRERGLWLREEQTRASQAFLRAAWAAIDWQVTDVHRALQQPDHAGLNEAYHRHVEVSGALTDAMLDLRVVAEKATLAAAMEFADEWSRALGAMMPPRGTVVGGLPLETRAAAMDRLRPLLSALPGVMRHDLGVSVDKADLRKATSHAVPEPIIADDRAPDIVLQTLKDRQVRRLADSSQPGPGEDYLVSRSSESWQDVVGRHPDLPAPLAALLRHPDGLMWHLAMASDLSRSDQEIVAERVLLHIETAGFDSDSGGSWIDQGARLWAWGAPEDVAS